MRNTRTRARIFSLCECSKKRALLCRSLFEIPAVCVYFSWKKHSTAILRTTLNPWREHASTTNMRMRLRCPSVCFRFLALRFLRKGGSRDDHRHTTLPSLLPSIAPSSIMLLHLCNLKNTLVDSKLPHLSQRCKSKGRLHESNGAMA